MSDTDKNPKLTAIVKIYEADSPVEGHAIRCRIHASGLIETEGGSHVWHKASTGIQQAVGHLALAIRLKNEGADQAHLRDAIREAGVTPNIGKLDASKITIKDETEEAPALFTIKLPTVKVIGSSTKTELQPMALIREGGIELVDADCTRSHDLLNHAMAALPLILERERDRALYGPHKVISLQDAVTAIREAIEDGDDATVDAAGDAIADLVRFIGQADDAPFPIKESAGIVGTDTLDNTAEAKRGFAGYRIGEPALYNADGEPIPARIARHAFAYIKGDDPEPRESKQPDWARDAEEIAHSVGAAIVEYQGGGRFIAFTPRGWYIVGRENGEHEYEVRAKPPAVKAWEKAADKAAQRATDGYFARNLDQSSDTELAEAIAHERKRAQAEEAERGSAQDAVSGVAEGLTGAGPLGLRPFPAPTPEQVDRIIGSGKISCKDVRWGLDLASGPDKTLWTCAGINADTMVKASDEAFRTGKALVRLTRTHAEGLQVALVAQPKHDES